MNNNDIFDYIVECVTEVEETLVRHERKRVRTVIPVTFEQEDDSRIYSQLAQREARETLRKGLERNGMVPLSIRTRISDIKPHNEVKI